MDLSIASTHPSDLSHHESDYDHIDDGGNSEYSARQETAFKRGCHEVEDNQSKGNAYKSYLGQSRYPESAYDSYDESVEGVFSTSSYKESPVRKSILDVTQRSRRKKRTMRSSRLRAALDFLTSIPLGTNANDNQMVADRLYKQHERPSESFRRQSLEISEGEGSDVSTRNHSQPQELPATRMVQTHDFVGIRLPGQRYKDVHPHGQRDSDAFKKALLRDGVLSGRFIYSLNKGYPILVSSLQAYDSKQERKRKKQKQKFINLLAGFGRNVNAPSWQKWRGTSYAALLQPTWGAHVPRHIITVQVGTNINTKGSPDGARNAPMSPLLQPKSISGSSHGGVRDRRNRLNSETSISKRSDISQLSTTRASAKFSQIVVDLVGIQDLNGEQAHYPNYRPFQLDDPEIDFDRGRTIVTQPGFSSSILSYRTESAKKDDINLAFRQRHPWVCNTHLSLSQLRKLRRMAVWLWRENGLELATVAVAFTYFEKCIYQGLVDKQNRRLVFLVCLVLAFKFNEPAAAGVALRKPLISGLEKAFGVAWKDVLRHEFVIWVGLGFSLHVHLAEVVPHIYRILKEIGVDPSDYFGSQKERSISKSSRIGFGASSHALGVPGIYEAYATESDTDTDEGDLNEFDQPKDSVLPTTSSRNISTSFSQDHASAFNSDKSGSMFDTGHSVSAFGSSHRDIPPPIAEEDFPNTMEGQKETGSISSEPILTQAKVALERQARKYHRRPFFAPMPDSLGVHFFEDESGSSSCEHSRSSNVSPRANEATPVPPSPLIIAQEVGNLEQVPETPYTESED